jgi:hypothetical protein
VTWPAERSPDCVRSVAGPSGPGVIFVSASMEDAPVAGSGRSPGELANRHFREASALTRSGDYQANIVRHAGGVNSRRLYVRRWLTVQVAARGAVAAGLDATGTRS